MENSSGEPASTCSRCSSAISQVYFTNLNAVICPPCHSLLASGPRLHGFVAFLRAFFFGGLAALICAALSFAISYLTGYELALVWIFLGLGIGIAVHVGSEGRGGWGYSLLASFLTYVAIGISLLGLVGMEMHKDRSGASEADKGKPSIASWIPSLNPAASPTPQFALSPTPESSATPEASATPGGEVEAKSPPAPTTPLTVALGLVFVVLVVCVGVLVLPVAVAYSSPISILIYGFGMHSAWKACKRAPLELAGPFESRPVEPEPPQQPQTEAPTETL